MVFGFTNESWVDAPSPHGVEEAAMEERGGEGTKEGGEESADVVDGFTSEVWERAS